MWLTALLRQLQGGCGDQATTEHIVGARFILQGHRILNSNDESELVQELRDICHASKYNVTVFHPYFIYVGHVTHD